MDGKKVYAKEIYKNPDKYFTEEIMQKLDDVANLTEIIQLNFDKYHLIKYYRIL